MNRGHKPKNGLNYRLRNLLPLFVALLFCVDSHADNIADLYRKMTSFEVIDRFAVRDLVITRNFATIELTTGEVTIIQPVGDRYHAVLFTGKGTFRFRPPNGIERDQLHKFTATRVLEEPFQSILLRFSDSTAQELMAHKPASGATSRVPAVKGTCNQCGEVRNKLLKQYFRNVDSRILRDFYSRRNGYFSAYVFGESKGEFFLEIDPEQREQVSITQQSRADFIDVWCSFSTNEPTPEDEVAIPHFEAEIDLERNGDAKVIATLDIVPRVPGTQTVPLNFSSLMEITKITDADGKEVPFIYETAEDRVGEPPRKQDKLDLFFPLPIQAETTVKFVYSSKHWIEREGSRNEYFILDTTGWIPTYGYLNRSSSKVTYCYPQDLELFAVGKKLSEQKSVAGEQTSGSKDNKKQCSTWEQQRPVTFVSFSLGEYKHKQISVKGLPTADIFSGKQHSGFRFGGTGLDNVAADIVNSLNFFQALYGPYPFLSILATEIPASHGQGFPGFLHLSRQTFEDVSLTGIDESFRAHEVSHQWWGHLIGWETYHDQWISEGFAEFSGALYADAIYKQGGLLMKIVESWKDDVLNRGSVRTQRYGAPKLPGRFTMGTEAGPIWLGLRLRSSKSPADYQLLVYQKGAYVLHMLRLMMKDFQTNSDERFFTMMKDFVKTYSWKNASTQGFQEIAEKHFGESLKWFFDQWVYGTYVPKYEFQWRIEPSPEGKYVLICDVKQRNVPDGFRMPVPIYLDFGKGRFAVQQVMIDEPAKTLRIPLPEKPRNVQFNYQRAVLCYD